MMYTRHGSRGDGSKPPLPKFQNYKINIHYVVKLKKNKHRSPSSKRLTKNTPPPEKFLDAGKYGRYLYLNNILSCKKNIT